MPRPPLVPPRDPKGPRGGEFVPATTSAAARWSRRSRRASTAPSSTRGSASSPSSCSSSGSPTLQSLQSLQSDHQRPCARSTVCSRGAGTCRQLAELCGLGEGANGEELRRGLGALPLLGVSGRDVRPDNGRWPGRSDGATYPSLAWAVAVRAALGFPTPAAMAGPAAARPTSSTVKVKSSKQTRRSSYHLRATSCPPTCVITGVPAPELTGEIRHHGRKRFDPGPGCSRCPASGGPRLPAPVSQGLELREPERCHGPDDPGQAARSQNRRQRQQPQSTTTRPQRRHAQPREPSRSSTPCLPSASSLLPDPPPL